MQDIEREIVQFREARERFAETSQQIAALQLLCGIDLSEALVRTGESRKRIVGRIRRAMERERLRGTRGSANYDLNRHIALKRTLDRLAGAPKREKADGNANGARRRRSTAITAA